MAYINGNFRPSFNQSRNGDTERLQVLVESNVPIRKWDARSLMANRVTFEVRVYLP